MKIFRHIVSLLLVAAFLNVYVSKTVHEVFEHEHEIHACENQDLDHYHEDELSHQDLICSFNFSSTELVPSKRTLDGILFDNSIKEFNSFKETYRNVYLEQISLRGPPVLNS